MRARQLHSRIELIYPKTNRMLVFLPVRALLYIVCVWMLGTVRAVD